MRHPKAFGLFLAAALLSTVAHAGPRVEARFPVGALLPKKIADTTAVTSQLFDQPLEPRVENAVPPSLEGVIIFEGARWKSFGAQREALLQSLEPVWGRPVTVSEDGPTPGAARVQAGFDAVTEKSAASALSLVPGGLTSGLDANRFYDGSRTQGEAAFNTASVVPGAIAPRPAGLQPAQKTEPIQKSEPPSPVGPYDAQIRAASAKYGVPPETLRAVAQAKSGLNARHVSGEAYGLMGLSQRSFNKMGAGGDILDPQANLDAGARILSKLLEQFGGDTHRALAAYQVGPHEVLRSGGIPNDRDVKQFLAAYEKALRAGPSKPAVVAVKPPTAARRAKDAVQETLIDRSATGAARFRPLIAKMAARSGVDADLMEAMVMRESDGDVHARSKKGARGIAQLMPGTARDLGVKDRTDPVQSLRGMARHMDYLMGKFDNPVLAVAAFNAGEGRVERAGNKVPHLRETRDYVKIVFDNYYNLTGVRVDVDSFMAPASSRRRKK